MLEGVRYPRGTPYQGPHSNYDRLVSPEANLHRIVYGLPKPMLGTREHVDTAFFGRLFDELANAHAALVRICGSEAGARSFALRLKKELTGPFTIGVKQNEDDPRPDEWLVIVYNEVTMSLREPAWMRSPERKIRKEWVGSTEAARILGLTRRQAVRLMSQVDHARTGGRNELMIRRNELLLLANRPGRWKRRTGKAT